VAAAWATYSVILLAVLMIVGWWAARARPDRAMAAALLAPVSVVVAYAVNQPIAHLFDEARPFVTHPDANVLITRTTDPSFPSDHAVIAGAACVGLWLVSRRLGVLTGAVALLLALSRVYVGVHYPADVVVGLAEGGAIAALLWVLMRAPLTRAVARVRVTTLGSVVLRR
ncbi:MAG: phosphatase PAP2 family protein, partial [bacterium]|nr:phosphatase PAP2 family protein [bacterium]